MLNNSYIQSLLREAVEMQYVFLSLKKMAGPKHAYRDVSHAGSAEMH